MKNQIALTFATLTLAAGLLLSVAAQNSGKQREAQPKNPPANQPQYEKAVTMIGCKASSDSDVQPTLMAHNNTGQTIKVGTVIHYSTNSGVKGSMGLNADLAAGAQKLLNKKDGHPYTCKAWFVKQ